MIRSTITETHDGKLRWSCSCRFSPPTARLREDARYVRFSLLKEAESSRAPLPSWTSTTSRRWNQRLGHIIMFEAMPDSRAATKLLMIKRANGSRSGAPRRLEQGSACLIFHLWSMITSRSLPILRGRIPIITTGC